MFFFTEEASCTRQATQFHDNSGKDNKRDSSPLLHLSLAYANYRRGSYKDALMNLKTVLKPALLDRLGLSAQDQSLLGCFCQYLRLKAQRIDEEKLWLVLNKFCRAEDVEQLYAVLNAGATPLDPFLLKCDTRSCAECRYRQMCSYERLRVYFRAAGEALSRFTDVQSRKYLEVATD